MFLGEHSLGLLAFVLILSPIGCGATVKNDSNSSAGSASAGAPSGAGAAPIAAGSGGAIGSGGMSSAVGGSTSMAGAGSSGGAPTAAICSLPWAGGDCDGAFPRYWHNPASGQCELRSYGGCGGNANRFATLEECTTTCQVGADPRTTCNQATDCELRSAGCCAYCEPVAASHLIAVNRSAPDDVTCEVLCGACPPAEPNESTSRYFVPGCVAHRCTVVDIRETAITECATSSDCALRTTAACCTGCGASGDPIAYNKSIDQVVAFCGGEPTPCPACVGYVPEGFVTACRAGRCVVELVK
jgi:hypothetical protein